ncbi:TetR family transcriptional regulator [Paenibacillus cellulosilyticus]|uniref:TetR family transcriptional regulator n=1 Tax=Paenibacillus cellulosilyticus TaxID=375489 RepID=A0A2V2YU35_9BACL|nr:TetR/AcrR family transcriptional regulator [Paenibacillus cellulosilyticus]PWW02446.1 TetR family transcriptional regulator [Paenibacillus cellulosilyticus]QKS47155.1 TetR/AcrR family transcriptional regulator [Paenibacillus cellulosilyticus]
MNDLEKGKDRQVQRTRQLLQQAFIEVVREKGFEATRIQNITDRANVNRGTFYFHYADKYALLDAVVRSHFGRQLAEVLPAEPRWDRYTLRLLVLAVLERFESKYQHRHPSSRIPSTLLEGSVQDEMTLLLITWLKRREHAQDSDMLETSARVISWAIFGTALQWSQEPLTISRERMADTICSIIAEGDSWL